MQWKFKEDDHVDIRLIYLLPHIIGTLPTFLNAIIEFTWLCLL